MSRIKKRNLAGYVPSPESMCNPLELVNIRTWGGASDVDMPHASHHKTLEMAGRYKQDAQSLLEIARNQRWRSVYVANLQAAAGVNVDCSTDTLPTLAANFFDDMVKAGHLAEADLSNPIVVANACLENTRGWDLKTEVEELQKQLESRLCGRRSAFGPAT
ncbi:hypothetical protein H257_19534 [Aphanomyces astaci]|uniref:Uncharacterized protein n=1 Tax=Aphanomyces astaci TaxID=112090 RepID=W4F9P8_APHAT|nr:hypothetical protein H257_19534 [Aphanomyces astaci]ETV63541.1 hypothetical protein H257_19534 [Aphanomyces astaci]|eukprot:XP_009846975.1 hypothetical protein H257_19534 [Aphanomyces astaci]